jgi:hypothetical protein
MEVAMARKKNGGKDSTDAEGKPVDMTGFTLLQIIAWTNKVVIGCKEQLETEKKAAYLLTYRGKSQGVSLRLRF